MNRIIFVLASLLSIGCAAVLDWRIVGGSKAEDGQFPYEVFLIINDRLFCGGSIINEDTILTAAHCVFKADADAADGIKVVAGTNKLREGGDIYNVKSLAYHENFTMSEFHNDVAVLKIDGKISFNDKVQPIPLETTYVGEGVDLVISGWGLLSYPGTNLPNDLQFLHLKSIASKECNRINQDSGFTVDDTQLCTFTRRGQGVCSGDSGSPLVHDGKVAGIASWSAHYCAKGYPDVFTRVSKYLTWIEKHI